MSKVSKHSRDQEMSDDEKSVASKSKSGSKRKAVEESEEPSIKKKKKSKFSKDGDHKRKENALEKIALKKAAESEKTKNAAEKGKIRVIRDKYHLPLHLTKSGTIHLYKKKFMEVYRKHNPRVLKPVPKKDADGNLMLDEKGNEILVERQPTPKFFSQRDSEGKIVLDAKGRKIRKPVLDENGDQVMKDDHFKDSVTSSGGNRLAVAVETFVDNLVHNSTDFAAQSTHPRTLTPIIFLTAVMRTLKDSKTNIPHVNVGYHWIRQIDDQAKNSIRSYINSCQHPLQKGQPPKMPVKSVIQDYNEEATFKKEKFLKKLVEVFGPNQCTEVPIKVLEADQAKREKAASKK